jgi:hypothetical protein
VQEELVKLGKDHQRIRESDLRDGKYPHEEARGIDLAIRALLAALPDDHAVLQNGFTLFEGLYATITRRSS